MPPCMVLFTAGSNKGPDLAERIHPTAFPFNKTRRMPIMGPLLQTQLPDLPFKLDTRAVEVCGKLTLPYARVRVSRRKRRGRRGGDRGTCLAGTQQAAGVWKVTVKCVADSSAVVSVGGLERNVGCCDRRGGNGSLQNGLGGHRQSGEGVKR